MIAPRDPHPARTTAVADPAVPLDPVQASPGGPKMIGVGPVPDMVTADIATRGARIVR